MNLKRILMSLAISGMLVLPAAGYAQSSSSSGQSSTGSAGSGSSDPNHTQAGTGMTPADMGQNASGGQETGAAGKSGSSSGSLSQAEQKFLMTAAKDNLGEIQMAKVAQQNASSPEIKQLAQQMETQHSQNQQQLQQLAQQKGVTLPDQPEAKQQAELSRLQKLNGKQFDQAYTSFLAKEHKKDIAEFQREQNRVKDPDVKSYIAQTLPTLQQHEHMTMQAQKGQPMSTGSSASSQHPQR